MTRIKRLLKWILLPLLILIIIITWIANYQIEARTEKYVFNDFKKIPHNKVGLLLGTSKHLRSGESNQYFENRITATIELFNAGKIDFVVISGDNSEKYYNEPLDMEKELIKNGVPEEKIYLDDAGFRTYDSVIRLNKIFGQNSFTVISQQFHNQRAIYIARSLGLEAVGYNSKDVDAYNGFKTQLREKFARVKVFIDLFFDKEPKFLGEKIEIK